MFTQCRFWPGPNQLGWWPTGENRGARSPWRAGDASSKSGLDRRRGGWGRCLWHDSKVGHMFWGSGTKEAHWTAPPWWDKSSGRERWWWPGGAVEATNERVGKHRRVEADVATVADGPGSGRRLLAPGRSSRPRKAVSTGFSSWRLLTEEAPRDVAGVAQRGGATGQRSLMARRRSGGMVRGGERGVEAQSGGENWASVTSHP
jgi:hypothetical protein